MKTELPIACTLSEPELRQRREIVLQQVGQSILETQELTNGFAYRLPTDNDRLSSLAEFIRFERECCPFLRFRLTVEPAAGPIWLELTGPSGVKDFLRTLITEA